MGEILKEQKEQNEKEQNEKKVFFSLSKVVKK